MFGLEDCGASSYTTTEPSLSKYVDFYVFTLSSAYDITHNCAKNFLNLLCGGTIFSIWTQNTKEKYTNRDLALTDLITVGHPDSYKRHKWTLVPDRFFQN